MNHAKSLNTPPLTRYKANYLYGFRHADGSVAIPAQYEWAGLFSEGLAPIRVKEKLGFINAEGATVIPTVFDSVIPFRKGKAEVLIEGKMFSIDTAGHCISTHFFHNNEVIPDEFLAKYSISRVQK